MAALMRIADLPRLVDTASPPSFFFFRRLTRNEFCAKAAPETFLKELEEFLSCGFLTCFMRTRFQIG
jgi:hypothetical protein